jgi:integrase
VVRAARAGEGLESPSTRRDYRSALDVHLLPAFGDLTLDKITPARIKAWRSEAMTPYVDEQGVLRVRLPRRTAQKTLAMLHGIFEHARKTYGLHANPAADVEQIKHTYSGSFDFYSPEEVWALPRPAETRQDAAIFLTAAFAGCRRGELCALRVRDVDFANRVIRVEERRPTRTEAAGPDRRRVQLASVLRDDPDDAGDSERGHRSEHRVRRLWRGTVEQDDEEAAREPLRVPPARFGSRGRERVRVRMRVRACLQTPHLVAARTRPAPRRSLSRSRVPRRRELEDTSAPH